MKGVRPQGSCAIYEEGYVVTTSLVQSGFHVWSKFSFFLNQREKSVEKNHLYFPTGCLISNRRGLGMALCCSSLAYYYKFLNEPRVRRNITYSHATRYTIYATTVFCRKKEQHTNEILFSIFELVEIKDLFAR